ncbi:HTH_Tnp_Tc3_2 domain-containing protein [Trichonephila clavipes]|nr:HTH_Tnp_Tc3_2 domain-containing protein [Trichonephila clavipes]
MYREYQESGETSDLRYRYGWKKIMQEQDQRRLTRIIKRSRRAILPQIAADFNAGSSTSVNVRTIQRNIINMGFRSLRPTRVPLLTAQLLKLYGSPGPVNTAIGLSMTGNSLFGLSSLVSN